MFVEHESEILLAVLTALFSLIALLLRQKDSAQEKQITALWQKHDQDVARLQELELKVASEHYVKKELNDKFNDLKGEIQGVREDLKAINKTLSEHVMREGNREDARLKWEKERGSVFQD